MQDNNESNTLERFKYVFSTGKYIDSLTLEGNVKNSFKSENIENIKLLLYRLDSSYTDSAIYKRKPDYVTSTLDSSNYKFSNLRKGNYLLVALKDLRSDYIFKPKTDEIGFLKDTISLPRDSIIKTELSIFKEELPYTFRRGKEIRKGQLIFGYQGKPSNLKIENLSAVPDNFQTIIFPEKDKDTLNLWHSPIEKDSLIFKISNNNIIDTITVALRKKQLDSLTVTKITGGVLNIKDTLFFSTNNPIIKIDTSKINFVHTDSIYITYKAFISKKESSVGFLFEKKFKTSYKLNLYPDALVDIFETSNDTVTSQFRTRSIEDYGEISLAIQNPEKVPVIIQLTDINDVTVAQETSSENKTISFNYLIPKKYKIRIIYDTNNNGKWDTGNYLEKKQPEPVQYFPEVQEIRPNWVLNEVIKIYGKIPKPDNVIFNDKRDTAFILTKYGHIPYKSKLFTNLYNCGKQNGNSTLHTTTIESACQNAINLFNKLYPKQIFKIKKGNTIVNKIKSIFFINSFLVNCVHKNE